MSARSPRGPIVIDTDVFGAEIVPGSRLVAAYDPIIVGRPAFISFQTATELRYGALRRNWGPARMLKLVPGNGFGEFGNASTDALGRDRLLVGQEHL